MQPFDDLGVRRRRPSSAPSAAASASRAPPSSAQRGDGLLSARLAVSDGIAEQRLLGVEPRVLVGIGDIGPVELVELVAQQVDLPRPHPLVAAERGQLGVDLGEARPRRTQRFEVDVAEPVECGALGGGRQQALVGVLTVEVDEPGGRVGQRRHRGRVGR